MRYYRKVVLKVSNDDVPNPKNLRFSEESETEIIGAGVATDLLSDVKVRDEKFPVGTYDLSLENLTKANWFYLKSDQDITVDFNGEANPKTFPKDRVSEIWMEFTAVQIVVATEAQIVIAFGGT